MGSEEDTRTIATTTAGATAAGVTIAPGADWSEAGWRAAVWAPEAREVALVLPDANGETREPLRREGSGWWRAAGRLAHGRDYAFALDGGPPRPDPRSAWQPNGVHAPSRVFDPRRHRWGDGDWTGRDARGALIYELHVGTFTAEGTLDAAADRLDHLVALGVEMVELMPLAAFPGCHGWGYDGVALYAVHDPYGGPAALQRFVDAAHACGLAVCLDVVYNHLGPSGNYLGEFGPYFTDRHETPWGQAVNLDGEDARGVRDFVLDNACRWLADFRIDALRLDAVHALIDDSDTHILAELSERVASLSASLGRPLSLIAESDENDPRTVTPLADGGLGMTAQWADDVHHAIHAALTGERHGYYVDFGSLETLEKALTGVFVHDGGYSTFRGRDWGAPVPRGTDGHRFVVFAQDHDQVGNRALGDRPSARLDDDGLAIAAALVLTSPFTPMLFMGEEWGARTPWQFFTDHQEPELATAIREGRAREFGDHGWEELYGGTLEVPDPQSPTTVEASRLDWSERDAPQGRRMLAWYHGLARLRREDAALGAGTLDATRLTRDADGGWLVVHRGDARVVVVLAEHEVELTLDAEALPEPLAAWKAGARIDGARARLPGRSVTILRVA